MIFLDENPVDMMLDDVVDRNDTNEDDVLDVDFLRESRVLCQS